MFSIITCLIHEHIQTGATIGWLEFQMQAKLWWGTRVIRLAAGHSRLNNWPMYWGMEIIVDKMPPLVSTWNSIVVITIHFIFKVGILIIFIVLITITTLLVIVMIMIKIFPPAPRPTQSYQLQCQAGCLRSDRPKIKRRLRIFKKDQDVKNLLVQFIEQMENNEGVNRRISEGISLCVKCKTCPASRVR